MPTIEVVAQHDDLEAAIPLPLVHDADSKVAASYRVLRHRIREHGDPQTIVVTSPRPHEGKTTVAINLAMAFAEHGPGKVLLVEANMRAPRLAAVLGFSPPLCFAKQMALHRANPTASWQVASVYFSNLHVLAVDSEAEGQWLIHGPALKLAMAQLRQAGYSRIVVDAPAVLGSADVNIIEDCADAVIFAARASHTEGSHLIRAYEHIRPAHVLGVVLIDGYC